MARKNFLKIMRELKELYASNNDAGANDDDTNRYFKSAEEYYSHPDQYWDAWVCVGDKDNMDDWVLEHEGTLDECLDALANWISVEVDKSSPPIENPGIELEHSEYITLWKQRQSQKRKEILRQCMTHGRSDSPGSKHSPPWAITCGLGSWSDKTT